VLGDQESYVTVRVVNPSSTTSVKIMQPQAYLTAPPPTLVVNGMAKFFLGFTGSTLERTSGNHTHVKLEFACPQTVVVRGVTLSNPCYPIKSVQTVSIRVNDTRGSDKFFTDPIVLAAKKTIKMRSNFTALAQFNATAFSECIAGTLTRVFPYISPTNAQRVIPVTVCEVTDAFGDKNDLGASVCGADGKCSYQFDPSCPNGVVKCACPTTTRSVRNLLQRYLLQAPNNTTRLAVEVNFDLLFADGFPGANIPDIAAAYVQVGDQTLVELKRDAAECSTRFGVDANSILAVSGDDTIVTAPPRTPAPTPLPSVAPTQIPSIGASELPLSILSVLLVTLAAWIVAA
jgi:hypothetical protein